MKQMARNLTDAEEGFLNRTQYLIHDRDPLFTSDFRGILKSSGAEAVRLPAQSPDLNAYAERFVRSIREECLSWVIPLGERHLRWVIGEYVRHYHLERKHQGLGNELIEPMGEPGREGSRVGNASAGSCGTTIGVPPDVGWVLAHYGLPTPRALRVLPQWSDSLAESVYFSDLGNAEVRQPHPSGQSSNRLTILIPIHSQA